MAQNIALVDDDRNILTSVSMALEAEGFAVTTYSDGVKGLAGITQSPPDLVVLDIKMPQMDGMEVLTNLRQHSAVPVIFLTSKDDELDEVVGLRMGADDYITKPFSQRLLLARIRALLRRRHLMGDTPPLSDSTGGQSRPDQEGPGHEDQGQYSNSEPEEKTVRGALELDDARHLCRWKGDTLNLTVTEYLLVKALALRPGHVKNRDQLIDQAYGENIYVDDRTIDSHIKRIRKKFRDADAQFDRIETIYGVGYRYKEDQD